MEIVIGMIVGRVISDGWLAIWCDGLLTLDGVWGIPKIVYVYLKLVRVVLVYESAVGFIKRIYMTSETS